AGTLRDGEELVHREVDFLEERRAPERFEEASRREQRIRLRPAELDLARDLAGPDPPEERASAAGRHRLELALPLHFLPLPADAARRHGERVGEFVEGETARVPREEVAEAIQATMLRKAPSRSSGSGFSHG